MSLCCDFPHTSDVTPQLKAPLHIMHCQQNPAVLVPRLEQQCQGIMLEVVELEQHHVILSGTNASCKEIENCPAICLILNAGQNLWYEIVADTIPVIRYGEFLGVGLHLHK